MKQVPQILIEFMQRIGSKSPRFFQIMQVVSICLLALSQGTLYFLNTDLWNPANEKALAAVFGDIRWVAVGMLTGFATGTTNPKLMDEKSIEKVKEHIGAK